MSYVPVVEVITAVSGGIIALAIAFDSYVRKAEKDEFVTTLSHLEKIHTVRMLKQDMEKAEEEDTDKYKARKEVEAEAKKAKAQAEQAPEKK